MDFTLEDLKTPEKLGPDIHLSATQELADEVAAGGPHGKSVFFATEDVEDAHALLWVENDKGALLARGEMHIRQAADAVISAWLATQSVANEVGSSKASM